MSIVAESPNRVATGSLPSTHVTRSSSPGFAGGSLQAIRSWMLPLVLALLPLLILAWDPFDETGRAARDRRQTWLERSKSWEQQMIQETQISFWAEELARQFSRRMKIAGTSARRNGDPSAIDLGALAVKARQEIPLVGLPPWRLWVASFPDGDVRRDPVLGVGPGLESSRRVMMSRILGRIGQVAVSSRPLSFGENWLQRAIAIFGEPLFPASFQRSFRGKAFHVIFERKMSLAVWDLIASEGRVTGIFLVVVPLEDDPGRQAMRLCLRNWQRDSRRREVYPGFVTLSPRDPQVPDRFGYMLGTLARRQGLDSVLQAMTRDLRFFPGRPWLYWPLALVNALRTWNVFAREPFPWTESWFLAAQNWLNRVLRLEFVALQTMMDTQDLGVRHIGEVVEHGPWWGRWFPAPPGCRAVGVMFARAPRPPPSFRHMLGLTWFAFVAFLAGWLAITRWQAGAASSGPGRHPGRWPRAVDLGGVRRILMAWFVGLIALPVALVLGTGAGFLSDVRANRLRETHERLFQTLREIETESFRENGRYLQWCRRLTQNPRLGDLLWRIREANVTGQAELDAIRARLRRHNVRVGSLVVVGHGNFQIFSFGPDFLKPARKSLLWLSQRTGKRLLGKDPEGIREWVRPRGMEDSALAFDKELEDSLDTTFEYTDRLSEIRSGDRHLVVYVNRVKGSGTRHFLVFLAWEKTALYRHLLRTTLAEKGFRLPGTHLAAFQKKSDSLVFVAPRGVRVPPHMRRQAQRARTSAVLDTTPERITAALPSRMMPGTILVAGVSLERINVEIERVRFRLIVTVVGILLFVVIAARVLAAHLGQPIEQMAAALACIAAGDLDVRVTEERGDELGAAARGLNEMTRALQERRKISSFVSPAVLAAIDGGNLDRAALPSTREVALLVSDIRSFTTLSEHHPPRAVFAALNSHLRAMTPVVAAAGGVIDRFIGDAIQVVFYPRPGFDPPEVRALAAARGMMRAHQQLMASRTAAGEFCFQIGVGIESGPIVTGILGDPEVRLDLSVLGEAMTRAAELESLSRHGRHSAIIVSARVRDILLRNASHAFAALPEGADLWEFIESDPDPRESLA
jgi:class 3 adenylate cyclase